MTIEESQKLMCNFIKYRTIAEKTKEIQDVKTFRAYERKCIEKFKYLVLMKVSRYRNFHNYEDLLQEGLEALTKAMKNYKPDRGLAFWWMHKYIDTRISRCANLHTTIRFPLKYTRQVTPHREAMLPLLVDTANSPHDKAESDQMITKITNSIQSLNIHQQNLVNLIYGVNDEPQSIAKVCEQLNISRPTCIKMLKQIFSTLKKNIQI